MRYVLLVLGVWVGTVGVAQAQLSPVNSGVVLQGRASAIPPVAGPSTPVADGAAASGIAWNTPIETVNLPGVPARRALAWLSSAAGITILVDWSALQAQGVDPEAPIDLTLHGVTFQQVLDLMLQQMQRPSTPYENQLVCEEEATFLRVLTKAVANQRLVVRLYDLAEVAAPVPSFPNAPRMDLASVLEGGGTEGGGVTFEQPDEPPPLTPTDRGEQIAQMVRDMIEPRVWQQNGGPASLRFYNGRLVANAPMYVQRQIGQALPLPVIGDPDAARYVGFSGGNVWVSPPKLRPPSPAPPAGTPVSPPPGTRSVGNIGAVDRMPARPIVGRER